MTSASRDNRCMPQLPVSSASITARRALIAAVLTGLIWTSFIVIARAAAMGSLTAYDISILRFIGAGAVLLLGEPLGWNLIAGLSCVTVGVLLGVRSPSNTAASPAKPVAATQ